MCNFEDEMKPPSANLQSGLFNEHSFKVFLYYYFALSKTNHEPQGGSHMSAELDDLYENAWHSVAKPPRRRSGIMREMPLSMRVPTVSPANDDNLCREMPLTEWWEKYPRGKEGVLLFRVCAATLL